MQNNKKYLLEYNRVSYKYIKNTNSIAYLRNKGKEYKYDTKTTMKYLNSVNKNSTKTKNII